MIRKQRTSWLRRGRRFFLNSSVRPKRHEYVSSSWRWSQSSNEMKPGISHGRSTVNKYESFSLVSAVFYVFVSDEKLRKTVCVKRKKRLVGSWSNRSTCARSSKSYWRSRAWPNHAPVTEGHALNRYIELNLPVLLVRNFTFYVPVFLTLICASVRLILSWWRHSFSLQRLVSVLLPLDLLSLWPLLLLKVTVWRQEGPVHTGEHHQCVPHFSGLKGIGFTKNVDFVIIYSPSYCSKTFMIPFEISCFKNLISFVVVMSCPSWHVKS